MQVLMQLCLHSPGHSVLEPTKRLRNFARVESLCPPRDKRDVAKRRQDKIRRLVAVLFSASHRRLRIRNVDLTYHPRHINQVLGVSDVHDWMRIYPLADLGMPMHFFFGPLGCSLASKYFWQDDALTYCKESTLIYFELPVI